MPGGSSMVVVATGLPRVGSAPSRGEGMALSVAAPLRL
jgi:hypothetical protein